MIPLALAPLALAAAVQQAPPDSSQGRVNLKFDMQSWELCGTPMHVSLWDVARNPDPYDGKAVITTGHVDPLDAGYLRLSEHAASVLLIPINADLQARMHAMWGRRVEVTGVVRLLRGPSSTVILCDLPPLPDLTPGRESWPSVSLTFWSVSDASEHTPKGEAGSKARLLETIAGSPADYAGRSVTVLGQFRGHNLFGDLPGRAWGRDDDWVLKSGAGALWVTGKKPRGKGWSLDPSYEPDSRFWLEVSGEVVVVGDVACLKAKSIALAKAPGR